MDKTKFYTGLNKTLLWVEGPGWSFAKKHWQLIVIGILALLLWRQCGRTKAVEQSMKNIEAQSSFENKSLQADLNKWKDKYGVEHVTTESYKATALASTEQVQQLTRALDIKTKQIQAITHVETTLKVDKPLTVDTTRSRTVICGSDTLLIPMTLGFRWSDSWMSIRGEVGDKTDSVHIEGKDTITSVNYWKRKKILFLPIGSKVGYIDLTNKNPYIEVSGVKQLVINPPYKKYSFGLSAQVGYPIINAPIQLNKPVVTVGLSIQRNLINF